MTVELLWCTEPANKVTKAVTSVESLTGSLRNPSSVIDPVITVARSSPVGFNYLRIPDFNRYYFVKNVVASNTGLITISTHVDVLMSFAADIRNCQAIVRRQENMYNLLLDDGIFKAYQNSKHKAIKFPVEFNQYSYILVLAGNPTTDS